MPLEPGRAWTYSVRTGYRTFVEEVTVGRQLSVGGARGFELQGPMGTSRMAWKRGELVASQLAGATLEPPLPLLVVGESGGSREWSGDLRRGGRLTRASATLSQIRDTIDAGTARFDTLQSRLVVTAGADRIELQTWFAQGVGIVRQEQRTNGRLDVALSLVKWE